MEETLKGSHFGSILLNRTPSEQPFLKKEFYALWGALS